MSTVIRFLRHLWADAGDVRRKLDSAALQRLEQLVADSEARHSGEICLCVEAALPLSYLWRQFRQRLAVAEIVHQRALSQFGKLRVWDTEHNNGVLIYLQLTEHRIEIVADRGLVRRLEADAWQAAVAAMRPALRAGQLEQALASAVKTVGSALERHFPLDPATSRSDADELPNRPVVQ
ncbi:TPM domain-containing protein [Azoarcus sp. TTM-91]|uniref:TPM domain-containing protein n=1 Tax=Azoarcus sp. TTM-91 TaxID=2691581 RepID=UPI00145CD632|nr:TPM domain-containing protein [Azoarcus sp. TTM-91]NMG37300.1 TPM domain-containing protein [Azoarcus sp. TTM-91]